MNRPTSGDAKRDDAANATTGRETTGEARSATGSRVGRRGVLGLSATALVALAGCTGGGGDGGDGGSEADTTTSTTSTTTTATDTTTSTTTTSTTADGSDETTAETTTTTTTTTATTTTTRAAQSAVTVTVAPEGQLRFEPETFVLAVGGTVTWEWGGNGHNVVADTTPAGSDWSGSAGAPERTFDRGHTHEFTFETAGQYEYFCNPHQSFGMVGSFTVE